MSEFERGRQSVIAELKEAAKEMREDTLPLGLGLLSSLLDFDESTKSVLLATNKATVAILLSDFE